MNAIAAISRVFFFIFAATYIAAELGSSYWVFDLLVNLRFYFLVAILVFALPMFFGISTRIIWIMLIAVTGGYFAFQGLRTFVSQYIPQDRPIAVQNPIAGPLQVTAYNLLYSNTIPSASVSFFEQQLDNKVPQILFLTELTERWEQELNPLRAILPSHHFKPINGPFGLGVFTNLNTEEATFQEMNSIGTLALVMKCWLGPHQFLFIGVHPPPPISQVGFDQRNEYLNNIRTLIATAQMPTIVAGDFNTTPWSDYFKKFLNPSSKYGADKLIDPGDTLFRPLTWNSGIPKVGLPIDYVLHSPHFSIDTYKIGPNLGSDHRPVTAVFK